MGNILICYAIAIVLLVPGGLLIKRYALRNAGIQWKGSAFFGGILLAPLYFLIAIILFKVTFSGQMYYDTAFFRTIVGFIFLSLLSFVRFLVLKIAFFNRDRESGGLSLSWGFGIAPMAVLAIYMLLMFLVISFNGIFNGPCVMEAEGLLGFADNTMISVFQPAGGHISFSVLFLFFCIFNVFFSQMIEKITNERHPLAVVIIWPIVYFVLEAMMILPVPFMKMFGFEHYALPILGGICAVIAFLLVKFMPQKEVEGNYTKQFD